MWPNLFQSKCYNCMTREVVTKSEHTTSTQPLTCGPVYSNAPYSVTSDSRSDNAAESRAVRFDPADSVLRCHGAAEVTPVNETGRHVYVYVKSIAAYRTHTHTCTKSYSAITFFCSSCCTMYFLLHTFFTIYL